MKRKFEASLLSALVVAAGLVLAPADGVAQSTSQLKQMSVEQLLQRQKVLQGEIEDGAGNRKKRQLRRVQRELQRRETLASQPEPVQPEQKAEPDQAKPEKKGQRQQAQPAQQPQAQPQQAEQSTRTNRQARRYLGRKTNIRSLSDADLRVRVRDGRNLLKQDGLSSKLKQQVEQQVKAARDETARRAAIAETPTAPAAPEKQVQSAPDSENDNVNRTARAYLRNTTNVRDMNDGQLRTRIRDGRRLLQQDGLSDRLTRQVRSQMRLARNESKRRSTAANPPQAKPQPDTAADVNRLARRYLRHATSVRDMNDSQLRARIRDGRRLLQQDGLSDKLTHQVRGQVRIARNETNRRSSAANPPQTQPQSDTSADVNRRVRRYLRNTANVRNMNDTRLRARIRAGRELLKQDGMSRKLKRQVHDEVRTAQSESERRSQSARQPDPETTDANARARDLLADGRPASSLRTPQLRRRLDRARRIMRDRELNRRLFRRVRKMARSDRDELRERIARGNRERAEQRADRQDLRQLLSDRRDARDLNDRQLQARITSARDLLSSAALGPGQKDRLRVILREARREKRRRLIVRRADRRERLRRERDNAQIVIQIPPVRIGPDRDDIAAAEADDKLLEQQLIAPPRRRIERRYTRQDFRSGRTLSRGTMPAIEVDTIRFGFNEAFVREEEIPQLERLGEIIERIVAGNSGEVFLIEGHTDAVGSATYNQALSFERASAVRDAMLQYFNVESENIEIVGYGERFLKINTPEEEPENRRVTIRRITPLLASQ